MAKLLEFKVPSGQTALRPGQAFKKVQKIIIPGGVKAIDVSTFLEFGELQEINFPEGIEFIGDLSFHGCHKLKEVILPDSVRFVGMKAFARCDSIKRIRLSAKVTKYKHTGLKITDPETEVIIPAGMSPEDFDMGPDSIPLEECRLIFETEEDKKEPVAEAPAKPSIDTAANISDKMGDLMATLKKKKEAKADEQ